MAKGATLDGSGNWSPAAMGTRKNVTAYATLAHPGLKFIIINMTQLVKHAIPFHKKNPTSSTWHYQHQEVTISLTMNLVIA
jgi:hypothetical protein